MGKNKKQPGYFKSCFFRPIRFIRVRKTV